ncbi:MAG TPA: methyltransferase domain-containing protein [Acidiphilium sp.]|nr:methyltransferase domain-containing protein [Acidiphilium sp.]
MSELIAAAPAAGAQPEIAMAGAYPDFANPELLAAIPLDARTVIDVGCSGGALGAAYLRLNPRARVLGVDADATALELARTRLTEVALCDIETDDFPFDLSGGVDVLVYGDVLEHMADPWAVLSRHLRHLNPGGSVIVCFPNVEHWSIVYRLFTGQFDYDHHGLLDRTHLRFFTARSMRALLEQVGLTPCDVRSRPSDQGPASRFVEAITPALAALGIAPSEYLDRATPVQFIWRASRNPRERLVVISTMLPPQGGVSDVRVIEPAAALASDPTVFSAVREEAEIARVIDGSPHIAVLHRPLLVGDAGRARVRALIDRGFLVVTEFDDHPDFLAARGIDVNDLLTFTGVHAIQTSTEPLATTLSAWNSEIAVFPNAIRDLEPPANFANPDRLTMFFGALNREEDWAPFIPVLNEVLRAVGPRLHIHVMHDRGFFDALETPHKDFVPISDYVTYRKHLSGCEISFMPLADTTFNRGKSDLKFIEAAAARVIPLASTVVYGASLRDGETGLLFTSPDHLRMQLLRLLAYPEAARRLADAARAEIAANRMLAYQVRARTDWYRSLWARREELDAALRARVPALFM